MRKYDNELLNINSKASNAWKLDKIRMSYRILYKKVWMERSFQLITLSFHDSNTGLSNQKPESMHSRIGLNSGLFRAQKRYGKFDCQDPYKNHDDTDYASAQAGWKPKFFTPWDLCPCQGGALPTNTGMDEKLRRSRRFSRLLNLHRQGSRCVNCLQQSWAIDPHGICLM